MTTTLLTAKKMIELTVDGQAVRVFEGSTILDACRQLSIETPTLCYDGTRAPVNVCRVCVVEHEGSRTLGPSCSLKAEPGVGVHAASKGVRASRCPALVLLA